MGKTRISIALIFLSLAAIACFNFGGDSGETLPTNTPRPTAFVSDDGGFATVLLNNDSDRGVYTCSVPVQPWYPQRIGYTLRLEGESIRTEEIEIDSWVFPLNFMIILCSVPAAVLGLTLFRKRYLNVNSDLTKPFGEKLKNSQLFYKVVNSTSKP